METNDLIRNLILQYYSILTTNPTWSKGLYDYLKERGITDDEMWEHCPSVARDGGPEEMKEPDWL